jgi:hypothetical protein
LGCWLLLALQPAQGLSQAIEVDILSAGETAQYSTHDTIDNFFDRVQPLEVSIQLKDSALMHLSQAQASERLQTAMRNQGVDANKQQIQVLQFCMDEALRLSQPLLRDYSLPDQIRLGIIKGDLYGPSVFYTREHGIFIPEPMIKEANSKMLTTVLIHEIFHIQSRTHPDLQERLYSHLGFEKLDLPIEYPQGFKAQTLLNPDGTDWDYYIPLSMDEKEVRAFPMIVSKLPHFKTDNPNFFSYLKFQLYPLNKENGAYKLNYTENFDGLNGKWMKPFFDRITKNTNYIIHPDELMADNFVLLTKWIDQGEAPKDLTEDGKDLLRNLASVYEVDLP